MTQSLDNRRPIKVRSTGAARVAAQVLADAGVSANAISTASLVFAGLAAVSLLLAPGFGGVFYLLTVLFCGLRLVANLLDGMVAVENGRASPTGPLFNELPDRISDVLILAAAGHAAGLVPGSGAIAVWGAPLGWLAAVLAVLTAYVRELGRALGAPADFSGPFAKQQRMWGVMLAAVVAFVLPRWAGAVLFLALFVIAGGTAYTLYLRAMRLAGFLDDEAADLEEEMAALEEEEAGAGYLTSDSEGEGRTSSPRET